MSNIVLKQLKFSNMFSYGENNIINLDISRITQLTAPNGSGKSSIAMIIQEILFNKNVKGIKKTDILNRWVKGKSWSASLTFTSDSSNCGIMVSRSGAQTKVKFTKDGVDESEHKVLDTYKKIATVIGTDFEVFSQLTYQSSTDLLDFLKATDTNRKKFLINLFNLEKYITIGDKIKAKTSNTEKENIKLQGELKSIEDFLNSASIPMKKENRLIPQLDTSIQQQIGVLEQEIKDYHDICRQIDKNNLYIQEFEAIKFDGTLNKPELFEQYNEYQTLKHDLVVLNTEILGFKKQLADLDLSPNCITCGQSLDITAIEGMAEDLTNKIKEQTGIHTKALEQAKIWSNEIKKIDEERKAWEDNQARIRHWETLHRVIDKKIPTEYPDIDASKKLIKELTEKYDRQVVKWNEAQAHNESVAAHNAKVDALIEQKKDFTNRQTALKDDILVKSDQINALNILKKAFSTSGIVAFKLENLTKELEIAINHYLSLLSDGQFQVEFKLDKEKLNIAVINNGASTPIETVSGGEFSRIQTSILLAIRTLLSKLGGSSINLLFLDEITGVLDDEGKDKLIEVLQQEHDLNVFLISHDFTHPLIDKISIIKEKNISSIQ
jgi:DNA repair exonuclease SbcCD ATPase subunit